MECDGFLASIFPFWRKMRKYSMHSKNMNSYTIHSIFAEVVFLCLSLVRHILIDKKYS